MGGFFMKVQLLYFSPHGTTLTRAEEMKALLIKQSITCDLRPINDRTRQDKNFLLNLEQVDLIGLFCPVYHMRFFPSIRKWIEEEPAFRGKRFFMLFTYSGITSGKALRQAVLSIQKAEGLITGAALMEAAHFWKDDQTYAGQANAFLQEFWNGLEQKGFAPLQPEAEKKVKKVYKKRTALVYPLSRIIGKLRELPIHISSDCKACGKCLKHCPGEALSLEKGKAVIDGKKCIHCYRCVLSCPFGYIQAPLEKMKTFVRRNIRIMGKEIPATRFFL